MPPSPPALPCGGWFVFEFVFEFVLVDDAVVFFFLLDSLLSELRAARGRAAAASWNVANAGVDGLLARPLLVTVGVPAGGAAGSLLRSRSASSGFGASFLFAAEFVVAPAASAGPGSFPVDSGLTGAGGSLTVFCSALAALVGPARSGVPAVVPFGLLEADDDGLIFELSAADWREFCLARDAVAGFTAGAGEPRGGLGSGRPPMTGDDVREGD